ncbi:MAG: response regulator [Oscillospiraceae bacterium]|nr:response regulator [Oscillospiraceae bacterium]
MQEEMRLKVLLVESDKEIENEFAAKIKGSEGFTLIKSVTGEKEALDLLANAYPDIVITELKLSQGDGINLICEMRELQESLPVKPYVVVLTNNTSDAVTRMLNHFADYTFIKGIEDFGADLVLKHLNRMKDFFSTKATRKGSVGELVTAPLDKRQRLRKHIEHTIVNRLSISTNLLGRDYIIEALLIGVGTEFEGRQTLQHTKDVYPILKARYKNRIPNINSAITVAIAHAWAETDEDTLQEVYSAYVNPDRGMPTSGEFLKYFVKKLKDEGWKL